MKVLVSFIFFLASFQALILNGQTSEANADGFSVTAGETHAFLIVISSNSLDIPEVRAGITKYLWKQHASDRLKITHIELGEASKKQVMYIEEFSDKNHAMKFYKGLKTNRPDFMQMGLTRDYYPISKSNYEILIKKQSLVAYKRFFRENYL